MKSYQGAINKLEHLNKIMARIPQSGCKGCNYKCITNLRYSPSDYICKMYTPKDYERHIEIIDDSDEDKDLLVSGNILLWTTNVYDMSDILENADVAYISANRKFKCRIKVDWEEIHIQMVAMYNLKVLHA